MEAKIEYLGTQYHKSPEKKTLEKSCKTTTPKRGLVCVLGGGSSSDLFPQKFKKFLKFGPGPPKWAPGPPREPKWSLGTLKITKKIMILNSKI